MVLHSLFWTWIAAINAWCYAFCFTARYGREQELLSWWTLSAHIFPCEYKLCSPIISSRNALYTIPCWLSYLSFIFKMLDPVGIANWSVTHVDWSEGKWHPKSYKAEDVSMELVKNITVRVLFVHHWTQPPNAHALLDYVKVVFLRILIDTCVVRTVSYGKCSCDQWCIGMHST